MKKNYTSAIVAITLIAAFATACTKSSSKSVADKLAGTWTFTRDASDTNHNGLADANEWFTYASMNASGSIKLNSNGTGFHTTTFAGSTDTSSFRWALAGSDTYLLVTDLDSGSVATGLRIDTLTDNVLVIKDTTGGTTEWTSMSK